MPFSLRKLTRLQFLAFGLMASVGLSAFAVSFRDWLPKSNASKPAAVSCQRAGEMIEPLELEVKELLERAAQAEAKETKETLDIPAELARHPRRFVRSAHDAWPRALCPGALPRRADR